MWCLPRILGRHGESRDRESRESRFGSCQIARKKNCELAKALNKYKSKGGSCNKAKQEVEFDDDTDKDLSLMDESVLSQYSYRSEVDQNKDEQIDVIESPTGDNPPGPIN